MSSVSGSEESNSESDIEIQSALPALAKNISKKTPKSPSEELLKNNQETKKMTTKDMIKEALTEQNSRKGISLHAIRKFIVEKHTVNMDRITSLIKKSLKVGIEEGIIVQTKGIGASGSFKLAPKKKPETTGKPKKTTVKSKTSEKTEKVKKTKKEGDKKENVEKKLTKTKIDGKTSKTAKKDKPDKKEKPDRKGEVMEKKEKSKMAKDKLTPAKKRAAMMKRKSIGSIIKPPKMKPKARI